MQRLALALAAGALAATASAQLTLVIPNGFANAEGSTSNAFPWGRTGIGLRHQGVYDSSHFTNQGVTFPIVITGLKWRPNGGVALVPSSYPSGCSVFLSTCPVDQNAVTANFAANRGLDYQQVFSGVVSWGAQAAQPGPTPFGISIPLSTPFVYNPNNGDLNIECDLPIQAFTGSGPQLDVHAITGQALASRVFMSTGYPTGGILMTLNHAVVVEVTYVPASGYAYSATYGTGCVTVADVSSYENFLASPAFDLNNTTISMIHIGNGYLAVPALTTFVPPSPTATALALTDDSEQTVPLSAPMRVGASGSTTTLTVCSNGFVSPGTGNGTPFTPAPATFLNSPRAWWSGCWHDYDPGIAGSGQVKFEEVAGVAYVTWDGVWNFGGTGPADANTFQMQFELASGSVHYVYQTMSALGNGFLVGFSEAGPSADPGSMDISAALPSTYMAAVFTQLPLQLVAGARPVIGTSINLNTSSIPFGGVVGLTIFGFTEFTTGIDLTFLGMPTCNLYTSLDLMATFLPAGSTGSSPLIIPNDPGLAGTTVLSQSAALVPGINPFGFVASNGVRLRLDLN